VRRGLAHGRPGNVGRLDRLGAVDNELGDPFDADDAALLTHETGQQDGCPTGPGADVEHPHAGPDPKRPKHGADGRRLTVGLAVADGQSAVQIRVLLLAPGQMIDARRRGDRRLDGVAFGRAAWSGVGWSGSTPAHPASMPPSSARRSPATSAEQRESVGVATESHPVGVVEG
jgi:hypothetical protein